MFSLGAIERLFSHMLKDEALKKNPLVASEIRHCSLASLSYGYHCYFEVIFAHHAVSCTTCIYLQFVTCSPPISFLPLSKHSFLCTIISPSPTFLNTLPCPPGPSLWCSVYLSGSSAQYETRDNWQFCCSHCSSERQRRNLQGMCYIMTYVL